MGPTKPASAKQPETTLKPAEFAGHGAAVRREEGKGGGGVCVEPVQWVAWRHGVS